MKKSIIKSSAAVLLTAILILPGICAAAEYAEYNGEYLARFCAQMEPVNGWELGEIAETVFRSGQPANISIDFGEPVTFGEGNLIVIETNLPNTYPESVIVPDPKAAEILSFKLDGKDVETGDVLISAEGMKIAGISNPGLRLTLTNKWNTNIRSQPVDPGQLGRFTTLEIEFVIYISAAFQDPDSDDTDNDNSDSNDDTGNGDNVNGADGDADGSISDLTADDSSGGKLPAQDNPKEAPPDEGAPTGQEEMQQGQIAVYIDEDEDGGFPGWAVPVIIGSAVIVLVSSVLIVLSFKNVISLPALFKKKEKKPKEPGGQDEPDGEDEPIVIDPEQPDAGSEPEGNKDG